MIKLNNWIQKLKIFWSIHFWIIFNFEQWITINILFCFHIFLQSGEEFFFRFIQRFDFNNFGSPKIYIFFQHFWKITNILYGWNKNFFLSSNICEHRNFTDIIRWFVNTFVQPRSEKGNKMIFNLLLSGHSTNLTKFKKIIV